MTKQEFLDKLDDLRAVADELSADVDIERSYLDDMGVGCILAKIVLASGIEKAAEAFSVPKLEAGRRQHVRYFAVGGVSVMQYEEVQVRAQTT